MFHLRACLLQTWCCAETPRESTQPHAHQPLHPSDPADVSHPPSAHDVEGKVCSDSVRSSSQVISLACAPGVMPHRRASDGSHAFHAFSTSSIIGPISSATGPESDMFLSPRSPLPHKTGLVSGVSEVSEISGERNGSHHALAAAISARPRPGMRLRHRVGPVHVERADHVQKRQQRAEVVESLVSNVDKLPADVPAVTPTLAGEDHEPPPSSERPLVVEHALCRVE